MAISPILTLSEILKVVYKSGLPRCSGKECNWQWRRCNRRGFDPWIRKIPWRRAWQPTLVFLPGESHGQSSLEGYSPWGCNESDTTKWLSTHKPRLTRCVQSWGLALCKHTCVCVCASMRWNLLEPLPTQGKSLSQPSARSVLPATVYMTASWFFKHLYQHLCQ